MDGYGFEVGGRLDLFVVGDVGRETSVGKDDPVSVVQKHLARIKGLSAEKKDYLVKKKDYLLDQKKGLSA